MIDGCPDGWAGGIPVCVLSGTAQQENMNGCASRAAVRDGTLVKERDYISLGLIRAHENALPSIPTTEEKMDCDNVELSLGLGPPADKSSAQETSTAEHSTAMVDEQFRLKVSSMGAKSQNFWHQNFRVSLSNEHHQHMVNRPQVEASSQGTSSFGKGYTSSVPVWSPGPGRFAVPVPKVSTIPAKRPYQDTNGERRSIAVADVASPNIIHSSTGMYSWNTDSYKGSTSSAGGWQQGHAVNFEHTQIHGGNMNSSFTHGSRQLAAALPTTSSFKVPQAASNVSMPPPTSTNGTSSLSQAVDISAQSELEHESDRSKGPVVGWPPVRSFRKNTLQAAQISNRMSAEDLSKSVGGPSTGNGVDVLDHMNGSTNKNAFFVKAKLDGVRICRKVDLKAYDSYDALKGALQDMFHGFVSDNAKLDLLTGNNYVVTHEDKDGDCLLVGDVPWHMFLESSVKSLRIMKAMDAIGIGEKGSAKLKAQANGKPSQ